jgi:carbon monoxide dehydrogenase subunit G
MKTILKAIGVIILLIVSYALVALLAFDKNYHYEKTITINAPIEKVWQHTNSMKGFNEWNPWMRLDKNSVITYKGISGEVGDFYSWKGNDEVGQGEQQITAIIPNEKMSTKIHFIKPFESNANSNVVLSGDGNNTKVTWDINFELSTFMKIMRPMMNYQMGKSYEEGLQNLKQISEK